MVSTSGGFLNTAAPIIGAGIDAISNVAGGLFSANQARKNRQWQTRMYERQLEDNRENWRIQTEYNTPKNQLSRIVEAGLNPLLMYGQGGVSNVISTAAQGANPGSGAMAHADFKTNFGQALLQSSLMQAQIRNMNASSRKMETDADKNISQTEGQNISNYIASQTKDLEVAIRYRDLDQIDANIRKLSNDVFQSSFMNAETAHTMAVARDLQIKYYHLTDWQVGESVAQGWKNIENGTIQANAAWRNSAAALSQAATAAKFTYAQIGQIARVVRNWDLQNEFLEKTMNSRVLGLSLDNRLKDAQRQDIGWSVLLKEAGIRKTQSEIFLNTIKGRDLENQMDWRDINNSLNMGARLFWMAQ